MPKINILDRETAELIAAGSIEEWNAQYKAEAASLGIE